MCMQNLIMNFKLDIISFFPQMYYILHCFVIHIKQNYWLTASVRDKKVIIESYRFICNSV